MQSLQSHIYAVELPLENPGAPASSSFSDGSSSARRQHGQWPSLRYSSSKSSSWKNRRQCGDKWILISGIMFLKNLLRREDVGNLTMNTSLGVRLSSVRSSSCKTRYWDDPDRWPTREPVTLACLFRACSNKSPPLPPRAVSSPSPLLVGSSSSSFNVCVPPPLSDSCHRSPLEERVETEPSFGWDVSSCSARSSEMPSC